MRLQFVVEPRQDGIFGETLGPLAFGLESDGCLAHVHGRGIGGCFRAAYFTYHHGDGWIGGNDAVLLTEKSGCLSERDARIGDGHEERGLFIERRHELRADGGCNVDGRAEHGQCGDERDEPVAERPAQHRPIDGL